LTLITYRVRLDYNLYAGNFPKKRGTVMKITCVLGSPRRKGNSEVLAKRFCDTAEKLGAQVQTFALNELKYRGCQACMACKTKSDKCVLQDDLTPVLESVREGDVLVMATPVYLWDVSSLLRGFIERTYSYFVPDFATNPNPSRLKPGKKLVFIQTQGQPGENMFADLFSRIEPIFKRYGFTDNRLIRGLGVRKLGEVGSREEVMKGVEEIARKIMG
jgi:multimeric flavodoxin WrbA